MTCPATWHGHPCHKDTGHDGEHEATLSPDISVHWIRENPDSRTSFSSGEMSVNLLNVENRRTRR